MDAELETKNPQENDHTDGNLKTVVPQDGGINAWCTVLGGWIALFATSGYTTSFGVYQDLYTRAGTSSSSNISWIGSVQFFLFVAMGLPAGAFIDKGYFRHVVLAGSTLYIFSLFMLSLAHIDRYYQLFLSQGLGVGIGTGLIYSPSMIVQAYHWRARRALAMGIVITGSSIGGIVYPIMLNNLFQNSVGFGWGVRISAFMTLGLLIVANCLMRSPSPKSLTDRADAAKPKFRDILSDGAYILTLSGGFFVLIGFLFPYFYLQLFTILHGLPKTFAFYTLTIVNGASVVGRIVPNFLADRFGVLNTGIALSFGTGVLVFALFGVKDTAGVVVFAVFYGFFSGGVLSLMAPVLASFVRDESELGVRMGFAYSATSFAYLIGPPIAGALLSSGDHWFRPIIFSGVIILAGIPFYLVGRSIQSKRKGTPYV